MAVSRDFRVSLDVDAVLAGQGCDPAIVRPRSAAVAEAAAAALETGAALVDPAVAWVSLEIERAGPRRVRLTGPTVLAGPLVVRALRGAESVVVAVATIGARLEDRVSDLLGSDPLAGLALDGFGTAALDQLVTAFCWRTAEAARGAQRAATAPLNPGMDGWDLASGQRAVFGVVDAGAIGVRLMPSAQMVPRKSVSLAIGIGARVVRGERACEWCTLSGGCRYRRVA